MRVKLKVVEGKPLGKEFFLPPRPFLIGRGPECQLRPNSDLISRQHCAIAIVDDTVRVRDLGSTNGTLVNGNRIEGEATIQSGDYLQVGTLVFAFELIAESSGAAATPKSLHDTISGMSDETVISRPRTAGSPEKTDTSDVPATPAASAAATAVDVGSDELPAATTSAPAAADGDVVEWLADESSGPISTGDTRTLSTPEIEGMSMVAPAGKRPDPKSQKTSKEPASKVAADILRKYLQDGRR